MLGSLCTITKSEIVKRKEQKKKPLNVKRRETTAPALNETPVQVWPITFLTLICCAPLRGALALP
jgi:hypothetical protein